MSGSVGGGFRDDEQKNQESEAGEQAQREERHAITGTFHQRAAETIAERSSKADGGGERSLREVEAPRAPGAVRNHEHGDHAEDRVSDPIQNLNREKRGNSVQQCIEHGAHRQDAEAEEQEPLTAMFIRETTDVGGRQQHNELSDCHASAHERAAFRAESWASSSPNCGSMAALAKWKKERAHQESEQDAIPG